MFGFSGDDSVHIGHFSRAPARGGTSTGDKGMAGESAGGRRVKAASRKRSRKASPGPVDGKATAQALALLPSDEWTVFRDVRWVGQQEAIEYVVVGPGGIFVVDATTTAASVKVRRDVMKEKGRRRDKLVSGVIGDARTIGGLVPGLDPARVRPVLCFARDERIMGWGRNVMVCSTSTLVPMLLTHPTVLDYAERQLICANVEAMIRASVPAVEQRSHRKAGPKHSAAGLPPTRTDRRGSRRAPTRTPAGALVPFGAVAAVGALVATNPNLVTNAGDLLNRMLG
jgi:hypothetical protein